MPTRRSSGSAYVLAGNLAYHASHIFFFLILPARQNQEEEVLKQDDRFIWIGLHEPTPELLTQVQQAFGLHELAIEDAFSAHQRPKIELYGESLFVVLRTAHKSSEQQDIEFGETHMFLGAQYIVVVRHG